MEARAGDGDFQASVESEKEGGRVWSSQVKNGSEAVPGLPYFGQKLLASAWHEVSQGVCRSESPWEPGLLLLQETLNYTLYDGRMHDLLCADNRLVPLDTLKALAHQGRSENQG